MGSNPSLPIRSEEHTSELQSQSNLVCRLLLENKTAGRRELVHRVAGEIDSATPVAFCQRAAPPPDVDVHPLDLEGAAERAAQIVFLVDGLAPSVIYTLALHDPLPI